MRIGIDLELRLRRGNEMKLRFITTRKRIIMEIAKEIADTQRRADVEYYKPHLKNYKPEANKNNHAAWLLDKVLPLRDLAQKMGISKEVYEEAYRIYDFRNSGKSGYTLKDGKIVRQPEPESEPEKDWKVPDPWNVRA